MALIVNPGKMTLNSCFLVLLLLQASHCSLLPSFSEEDIEDFLRRTSFLDTINTERSILFSTFSGLPGSFASFSNDDAAEGKVLQIEPWNEEEEEEEEEEDDDDDEMEVEEEPELEHEDAAHEPMDVVETFNEESDPSDISESEKSDESDESFSLSRPSNSKKNSPKNSSKPKASSPKLKSPKIKPEPSKKADDSSVSSTVCSLWEELIEADGHFDSDASECSDETYKPRKRFNPNTPLSRNSSSKKSPSKRQARKSSKPTAKRTQASQPSTKLDRAEFKTASKRESPKREEFKTRKAASSKSPSNRTSGKSSEPKSARAKARTIYAKLIAKYNRIRSPKDQALQIRWSRVTVHGWPRVLFYSVSHWNDEDMALLEAAMPDISFSHREPADKNITLKDMFETNEKLFDKLHENAKLLGLCQADTGEIDWRALHREFPEVTISTPEFKHWIDTDRETINKVLLKKLMKEKLKNL